ncbi:TetR/AcrR family transcriptional regulator [Caulobacter sp. NIBR2454]|uniref:TetR/AcrR family transcriptional regulator n=1 Tax=Caulobacter sp. NIBR2454 TaxID=3015996 RepID=UPI0022B61552|nr:TetR/AcrR family transcriptional regulator [Caulobacter sp. NIBR2454]
MTQTRLKGPERRERFLDAAAQIVIEQGVWAVTMDGVAARTGVNKSLGYRYFADRDALLEALFERETQVYVERLAADLPAKPNFEAWVRGALKQWFRKVDERGELFMRLTSDHGPLAERAKAIRQADAAGWSAGLQRAYRLPEPQARQYAWFMVAGLAGVLASRTGEGDEELIDTITLAVLAGAEALKAKYAPPKT